MSTALQLLATAGMNPEALLTHLLLPFLLIFAILWGLLSTVKLFGDMSHKINLIIALVFTIAVALTDAWGFIATQLAVFTGVFVYIMFFALFIILVVIWAVGRGREAYTKNVIGTRYNDYNDVKQLDKVLGKLAKKYENLKYQGRDAEANEIGNTIIELRKKKEMLILGKDLEKH